jgi:hypothetical protein
MRKSSVSYNKPYNYKAQLQKINVRLVAELLIHIPNGKIFNDK